MNALFCDSTAASSPVILINQRDRFHPGLRPKFAVFLPFIDWTSLTKSTTQEIMPVRLDMLGRFGQRVLIDRSELHLTRQRFTFARSPPAIPGNETTDTSISFPLGEVALKLANRIGESGFSFQAAGRVYCNLPFGAASIGREAGGIRIVSAEVRAHRCGRWRFSGLPLRARS